MNKKYKLTVEVINLSVYPLYRIQALRDFSNIKEGDFGGYIVSESNLSHDGDCWVYDDAAVYDNAQVYDDAKISEGSRIYDNAQIFGNAQVSDHCWILDNAQVYDDAILRNRAWLYENVQIFGSANILIKAGIGGDFKIHSRVWVDFKILGNEKFLISSTLEKMFIGSYQDD